MSKKIQIVSIKLIISLSLLLLIVLFLQKDKFTYFVNRMQLQLTKVELKKTDSLTILNQFNTKNEQLYLLEFGSGVCKPCKKMEQTLVQIDSVYAEKLEVIFYNITTSQGQKMAKYFQVQSMPVQVVLNNKAQEVFRNIGFIEKQDLQQKLDSLMKIN